ncbi:MAG: type IV pilus twitching motility protein PilT [Candidatus Gracilibacteria bacterium]|jgi:twitching motility protein PilT|nr:type IV pilus twitching motility protein PilT [Candidatus Gracilibacteria bacterium]
MDFDIFQILTEANEVGASDIHISTHEMPAFRVSGSTKLQEKYPVLTYEMARELIEQTMDDEQKKCFDDEKDLDYAIEIPNVARFRVNSFFTTKGVNAVFRIIPSEIIPFENLGLPESLRKIMNLKKGLVLVTGPTGSGKSTTLAAIIDLFNKTKQGHILTIEDPVEFVHQPKQCLITHREVGKHSKSFSSALRGTTRQDPDIVLVGEMRDLETISLALTAAESGALVFGTLHTSSAAKTINRIVDVFSAEEQEQIRSMLADSVQYIVAQALLKKKGGGRVGAYEVLIGTDAIRNQIRKNEIHQIPLSIQSGKDIGMQTMDQCLIDLIRSDKAEYKEAIVHAINKDLFDQFKPQEANSLI